MSRNIIYKNLTATIIVSFFLVDWWYSVTDWMQNCRCGLIAIGMEG